MLRVADFPDERGFTGNLPNSELKTARLNEIHKVFPMRYGFVSLRGLIGTIFRRAGNWNDRSGKSSIETGIADFLGTVGRRTELGRSRECVKSRKATPNHRARALAALQTYPEGRPSNGESTARKPGPAIGCSLGNALAAPVGRGSVPLTLDQDVWRISLLTARQFNDAESEACERRRQSAASS